MDWTKGFAASYHMAIVDAKSWRDVDVVRIMGGSISKESTGLRQSADVNCRTFPEEEEVWIRIWLNAEQTGDAGRAALFTGMVSVPETEIDGNKISTPLECYSVLKPAEDVLLQRGWYAPAGTNGAQLIKKLLSVSPAPITIEGESPALKEAIVAEDGENRLTMADKILDAIGWRLRINGMGEVTVCARASEPVATLGAGADVIEKSIKFKYDRFRCPNVFRAVEDDIVAVARDDSPDSPLSTVSRGREVWKEETSCDMKEGESVAEYAIRRLKEEQSVGSTVSYSRRFDPEVEVSDLVRIHYPGKGLDGVYRVESQTIDIDKGARTAEEVSLWTQ